VGLELFIELFSSLFGAILGMAGIRKTYGSNISDFSTLSCKIYRILFKYI